MKHILSFLFFLFLFSLLQCGGSKLEEGDMQFSKGNYIHALNNYLAYKKENKQDKSVNPRIALAYMNRGNELYKKTHNIETFSGNFEKANKFLDEGFTMPEQKKQYSDLLYKLALAYRESKPQNEIQEEQFFNNTLDYLGMALDNNENNQKADSLLNHIYDENFQKMFDKGLMFYKRAKKERNNPDLYLSAERYLAKAVEFNSGNKDAQKYLADTRKQTLGILQSNFPFSFCVPGYKITPKSIFIDFTIQNFSSDKIEFSLENLELVTIMGDVLKVDLKKTAELEQAFPAKTTLEPRKQIDGQIVFNYGLKDKIETLNYNYKDDTIITKYFP